MPSRREEIFDPTDIFVALNAGGVQYLVYGGLAVVLYGVSRLTWDVDLIVKLRVQNIERLTKALEQIGFRPRLPVSPRGLADRTVRQRWIHEKGMRVYSFCESHPPHRIVDVMVEPLKQFDLLYQQRTVMEVRGVPIPLLPVEALATLKRAAGRPQDLQDVEDLKRIGRIH